MISLCILALPFFQQPDRTFLMSALLKDAPNAVLFQISDEELEAGLKMYCDQSTISGWVRAKLFGVPTIAAVRQKLADAELMDRVVRYCHQSHKVVGITVSPIALKAEIRRIFSVEQCVEAYYGRPSFVERQNFYPFACSVQACQVRLHAENVYKKSNLV